MTDYIEIQPCGPIDSEIRPPGSKSLTNRALICAALANGQSVLSGALKSEDTEVMVSALKQLGVSVESDWPNCQLTVQGTGGQLNNDTIEMDLQNSGTSIRFLTALCSLGSGNYLLDGTDRMRQRPIQELVDALTELGGQIECRNGCPPVSINGNGLWGGSAEVRGDRSSQFLSGLMMILPLMKKYSVLEVAGSLVSEPYVQMTGQVMREFGVDVSQIGNCYSVDPRHQYKARELAIEPDATAASYFWAAAAITGGRCRVDGLKVDAIQGDVRFLQILDQMGCQIIPDDEGTAIYGGPLNGIEADMNDISDTVQTLAAVALFADGPTTITGVAHNRHKESDRIGDLATELRRMGAEVEELQDGMVIHPQPLNSCQVETYNDHRMAMALSLVGLKQPGIRILNPQCTGKTYPKFFDDLNRVCQT